MESTSATLLDRLRRPVDQAAWERFHQLYTPLLLYWAQRLGLQDHDAADLVQEVLTLLVEKLPQFRYDAGMSFRAWLRTVMRNRWRNLRRRHRPLPTDTAGLPSLEQLETDAIEIFAEEEYRQRLVGRALELMQVDFQPGTWRAFWECEVVGRPAAEVAAELGMGVGAVYVAKSRVLQRLREELHGLLD